MRSRPLPRRAALAAVLAVTITAAACGGEDDGGDTALTVAAAFYPLEEAARGVGGDLVEVIGITPPLWRRPRKPRETLLPLETLDGGAGVSALAWPRVDALLVGRADGTVERRPVGG